MVFLAYRIKQGINRDIQDKQDGELNHRGTEDTEIWESDFAKATSNKSGIRHLALSIKHLVSSILNILSILVKCFSCSLTLQYTPVGLSLIHI